MDGFCKAWYVQEGTKYIYNGWYGWTKWEDIYADHKKVIREGQENDEEFSKLIQSQTCTNKSNCEEPALKCSENNNQSLSLKVYYSLFLW